MSPHSHRADARTTAFVMKGMYGLDVLEKLREMDPSALIVIISADIQSTSREMVVAAGAAGFLNKPAKAEEIVAVVRQALERAQ